MALVPVVPHVKRRAYTMAEAACSLRLAPYQLYKVIREGQLRTYTIGRRRYVSVDALQEFIRRREHEEVGP